MLRVMLRGKHLIIHNNLIVAAMRIGIRRAVAAKRNRALIRDKAGDKSRL
ncbi:MAG TPA: hypothetical protein VJQ06_10465 [Rhizomicrobium sp.]|nr:hypothetical protein [Rhizomicrobium sp.]